MAAMRPSTATVLALLATALAAQTPGTLVVAARASATQGTILLEVDFATGTPLPLPSFASAASAALAIAVDPIDRSLLLALDNGTATDVVRLRRSGPAFTETALGSVPGAASAILVDQAGDVVVLVGSATGGVFRVSRHGGATTTIRSLPHASAVATPGGPAWGGLLALSGAAGPPVVDPGVGYLDFTNGQFAAPPTFFAGYTPRAITGIVDMATGVPRHILAHDDGTLALAMPMVTPQPTPLATTPALPPGGSARLLGEGGLGAMLLGDARHPFVHTFDPFAALAGSIPLVPVAGPLPGLPVDFALVPDVQASSQPFGYGCGTAAELQAWAANGPPTLGNAAFTIDLGQAVPGQLAVLALGFTELPGIPLPNGCLVHVLPAATAFHVPGGPGFVSQPLPIPNQPAFADTLLFAQWFQLDFGVPAVTSRVLALRVGP